MLELRPQNRRAVLRGRGSTEAMVGSRLSILPATFTSTSARFAKRAAVLEARRRGETMELLGRSFRRSLTEGSTTRSVVFTRDPRAAPNRLGANRVSKSDDQYGEP